jgi:hypothetical protein
LPDDALADTAAVILGIGTTLSLNYSGTDTVNALSVAGIAKSPGVYSSFNSSFITGSGTLTVLTGPPSDYETWKISNNINSGPNGDEDQDSLSNFAEYAFGLDPRNGSSTSPYLTLPNPTNNTLTYSRRKTSLSGLTYQVWFSTNLTTWEQDGGAIQSATAIPGTDNESVQVTLSAEHLNAGRIFVRIQTP